MRALPLFAAATSALFLGGCYAHFDHDASDVPTYHESEPNDFVWQADDFGFLEVGDELCIHGYMSVDGDSADALAFVVESPCVFDFSLCADAPWADFDVWVYDPWLDEYVGCFDGLGPVEDGSIAFDTGFDESFQLVIVPYAGASTYHLDVATQPLYHPSHAGATRRSASRSGIPTEVRSWSARRAAVLAR